MARVSWVLCTVFILGACKTYVAAESNVSSGPGTARKAKTESMSSLGSPAFVDESKAIVEIPDAATEVKSSPQMYSAKPNPESDGTVLFRWVLGRYSLAKHNDESKEVQNKKGKVDCEIGEKKVIEFYDQKKLDETKKAISLVAKYKDHVRQRNPIFVGLDESRELVAFDGKKEVLIEMMYQAREVITSPSNEEEFQKAFDLILEMARDERFCPKAKP